MPSKCDRMSRGLSFCDTISEEFRILTEVSLKRFSEVVSQEKLGGLLT
jgi:hypothetical protein